MKTGFNLLLPTGHVAANDFSLSRCLRAAGYDDVEFLIFDTGDPAHFKDVATGIKSKSSQCTDAPAVGGTKCVKHPDFIPNYQPNHIYTAEKIRVAGYDRRGSRPRRNHSHGASPFSRRGSGQIFGASNANGGAGNGGAGGNGSNHHAGNPGSGDSRHRRLVQKFIQRTLRDIRPDLIIIAFLATTLMYDASLDYCGQVLHISEGCKLAVRWTLHIILWAEMTKVSVLVLTNVFESILKALKRSIRSWRDFWR